MYACLYETVSHYLGRSGVQNELFCLKFEGSFGWNDAVVTTRLLHMLSEALPIIHIHLTKVGNHSSSNGCLSLHLNVTFARLNWCSKLVILLENWRFVSKKQHRDNHKIMWYAVTDTSNHPYRSWGDWEALKQQWMPVLTTLNHNSWGYLVSKNMYFAWNLSGYLVETTLWRPSRFWIC